MCGRFFLDAKNREIDRLLEKLPPDSVKTGEVFPGNEALVLARGDEQIHAEVMKWGFPRFDGKGLVFNARCESALDKPMFRRPIKNNPLIVPVSGFFEWKREKGKKSKTKYFFCNSRGDLLYLAGFWDIFRNRNGEKDRCFTILTTEANPFMREYHDRMPLLLGREEIVSWLRGENSETILASVPLENLACSPDKKENEIDLPLFHTDL